MSVAELTEADWADRVLGATVPVLVEVWAQWCMPCRRVEPLVVQIADAFAGRLLVGRLDADHAPEIVARYEILSLPTLLILRNGEVADRVVGVPKIAKLHALVERHVRTD